MFFDNIENVKDKAFDFMTEAQKQAALDLESEQQGNLEDEAAEEAAADPPATE